MASNGFCSAKTPYQDCLLVVPRNTSQCLHCAHCTPLCRSCLLAFPITLLLPFQATAAKTSSFLFHHAISPLFLLLTTSHPRRHRHSFVVTQPPINTLDIQPVFSFCFSTLLHLPPKTFLQFRLQPQGITSAPAPTPIAKPTSITIYPCRLQILSSRYESRRQACPGG